MDARLFAGMLSDKRLSDLKKMQYKYSAEAVSEFLEILREMVYSFLPLKDFSGRQLVWLESMTKPGMNALRTLLAPQGSGAYGVKAMEDEIHSTLTIENIDSSRESIRKILCGYAPSGESEKRIFGMKMGMEFISNPENIITEANLHKLYQIAAGDFLDDENKLRPGNLYRHDSVFVVGGKIEHQGLHHEKLPEYMAGLIDFVNSRDGMDDLLKASAAHFYIGYLHPWFDGNGRMARLLHLWYLVQRGYPSALFTPFSRHINASRKSYYKAYTLTEQNAGISGVIDITPFLTYFLENVYGKLESEKQECNTLEAFLKFKAEGRITEKECSLWNFVISSYGVGEFSTKQLEKDFGNAAYATIRGFVLKFESLGLLSAQKYSNRVKYRVCS